MGLLLGIIAIVSFIVLLATIFGIPYFLFLNYKEKMANENKAISL